MSEHHADVDAPLREAVTALADPEFCPIPLDDERGRAGWRFLQEHLQAVLDECVTPEAEIDALADRADAALDAYFLDRIEHDEPPRCNPVGGVHATWCPDRTSVIPSGKG